jgi:uncharacterized membrane protein (UPF0127 family)
MHKIKKIFLSALVLFLLAGLVSCEKDPDNVDKKINYITSAPASLPTERFEIGGESFEIELAFTRTARARGMMYRETVGKNEGMFFVFRCPQLQSFYMKNCLVDLDIVFIKNQGQIDRIDRMTVPTPGQKLTHYSSKSKVPFVLELLAGTCQRLGLKEGQTLKLPQRIHRIIPDRD